MKRSSKFRLLKNKNMITLKVNNRLLTQLVNKINSLILATKFTIITEDLWTSHSFPMMKIKMKKF